MTAFVNAGGTDDGVVGSSAANNKNGVVGHNDDTTARNAAIPEGNGVFGTTLVPDAAGIFGLHNSGGVGVAGFGHPAGIGVVGISAPANAKGGDGVLGASNSEHRNGIVGRNDSTTPRAAVDAGGNGVFGFTQVPDGAGVFGAHASAGVGVSGLGLIGVAGGSVDGVGVMGVSAPPGAKGGDGVQGITNSEQRNGVFGRNDSTTAHGQRLQPIGNGVSGYSQVPDGSGVRGAHGADGHGVIGTGGFGMTGIGTIMGVWGIAQDTGWAGYFSGPVRVEGNCQFASTAVFSDKVSLARDLEVDGNVAVGGNVAVAGNIAITGDVQLANRDVAEHFEVEPDASCEPGTVMVLGRSGTLVPCTRRYDRRAVGVISGAGTLRPAITLGETHGATPTVRIALVGTTYCRVEADPAPIEIGDMITTSDTAGHGMKADDAARSFGAIIGKALAPLDSGRALIPILLALQ
jgi:hypothetical protein